MSVWNRYHVPQCPCLTPSNHGYECQEHECICHTVSKLDTVSPRYLSRFTGVTRVAIYQRIRNGKLPAKQVDGRWRIKISDIHPDLDFQDSDWDDQVAIQEMGGKLPTMVYRS